MINRKMASLITLIMLINIYAITITGIEFYDTRDAEIDRLLKKLNKPAIKSIKSPDGDIIDCVHMKNHPIYDHPLFKNHTIQMRPSYPEEWNDEFSSKEVYSVVTQLWTINGKCPENSIPIRRTRREEILKAESIERFGKKDPNSIPQQKPTNQNRSNVTHEYAILRMRVNNHQPKFYGTKAVINVWKPYVQMPREFSLAQIWVVAGPYNELNSIEAGRQVYPYLYGDDNPRYFIYWTADEYKTTGCYNLMCVGFVPTNQEFAIGGVVPQVSTLGGKPEAFRLTIWKDRTSGHWWLKFGNNQIIGYWPSSLFNSLQDGAREIQWGGKIVNYNEDSKHTSTEMGSGRFAQERWKKASFFGDLKIIDEANSTKLPERTTPIMSKPKCYNLKFEIHPRLGHSFYFGGPGRSPSCP